MGSGVASSRKPLPRPLQEDDGRYFRYKKKEKKRALQSFLGLCGAAVIVMNSGGHCSDRHEKLFMPRTAQDNDAAVC